MTETQWWTTTFVPAMLQCLSQQKRRRKRGGPGLDRERFRTFAAACVRRVWPLLPDALRAVADGLERLPQWAREKELDRLREVYDAEFGAMEARVRAAVLALAATGTSDRREVAELRVRQGAAGVVGFATHADPYRAAWSVSAQAVTAMASAERLWAYPTGDPIENVGAVLDFGPPPEAEQSAQADLLRCIFGNPFRPVAFEAAWRTEAVVALARGVDESRDFAALPVLADALEDAGCADAELLAHCRGAGPHARGCHAIDHVLGRW